MTEESTAYIGLGSNLGNGRLLLRQAWERLGMSDGVRLDGLSSPYLSAPVGMSSPHWFTNAVGRLRVHLSPMELLEVLMAVERHFGRKRDGQHFGYQDRSLDLDLLEYGAVRLDTPELHLPHPRIGERLFVLLPFAELAPGYVDGSGVPVEEKIMVLRRRIATGEIEPQEIMAGRWDDQTT